MGGCQTLDRDARHRAVDHRGRRADSDDLQSPRAGEGAQERSSHLRPAPDIPGEEHGDFHEGALVARCCFPSIAFSSLRPPPAARLDSSADQLSLLSLRSIAPRRRSCGIFSSAPRRTRAASPRGSSTRKPRSFVARWTWRRSSRGADEKRSRASRLNLARETPEGTRARDDRDGTATTATAGGGETATAGIGTGERGAATAEDINDTVDGTIGGTTSTTSAGVVDREVAP